MNGKISIIVPVYNAEKYVEETILSVCRQTYRDWELLLVDDHSADRSVEIIEKLLEQLQKQLSNEQIHLIKLPDNVGAARTRNEGLKVATGRYVAYLDADDLWKESKLEHQLQYMQEKKAAFSFTGYEFADEQGMGTGKIVHVPESITYRQALQNTTIFTSTVIFDTTLISKDKLKMPTIRSEDTALWWKVLGEGYLAYGLDENLVSYRRIGQSLSSNKLEALRRIWNLYRKSEHLSIPYSIYNFIFWAVRAVRRRV